MTRAFIFAAAVLPFTVGAVAQVVEPVRPPPVITMPPVVAPTIQPLPLTPTLTLPQVPVLTPIPTPVAPVQVVPPATAEGAADAPDGSDSCDYYVTYSEPVYENGGIARWNPVRRWTGKSTQCCPQK